VICKPFMRSTEAQLSLRKKIQAGIFLLGLIHARGAAALESLDSGKNPPSSIGRGVLTVSRVRMDT
jgi:hypothetical protein